MTDYYDFDTDTVNLPPRIFLYTMDQVAFVLNMSEYNLKMNHVYFVGRSTGRKLIHLMTARNVAAPGKPNDWRVAETELVRWMKIKGFIFQATERLVH